MEDRKRIAIACQGGGSQCAFVAGALRTLLARGIQDRYRIVGLSGTSGGALTAALAWFSLLDQKARGNGSAVEDLVTPFWRDLTAQSPIEVFFDRFCVQMVRMTEGGMLPSIASSPSTPQFKFWTDLTARLIGRPEFTDLRAVVLKHMDFEALPALVQPDSPVLLVGAANVLEGSFKIFSSVHREIKVESLLASAAVPNLFPAADVDGDAYWDGIFSTNPPVAGFLRKTLMGPDTWPEEIWILQVNRAQHKTIPERPGDIFDRRNHLAGNLSLQHELELIDIVNILIQEDALTDAFRARLGIIAREPIKVRFLRMSPALQEGLDYPTKLSRQPDHIARLMADGDAQASVFLAELRAPERPEDLTQQAAQIATH
jgi:NTE family protein